MNDTVPFSLFILCRVRAASFPADLRAVSEWAFDILDTTLVYLFYTTSVLWWRPIVCNTGIVNSWWWYEQFKPQLRNDYYFSYLLIAMRGSSCLFLGCSECRGCRLLLPMFLSVCLSVTWLHSASLCKHGWADWGSCLGWRRLQAKNITVHGNPDPRRRVE